MSNSPFLPLKHEGSNPTDYWDSLTLLTPLLHSGCADRAGSGSWSDGRYHSGDMTTVVSALNSGGGAAGGPKPEHASPAIACLFHYNNSRVVKQPTAI